MKELELHIAENNEAFSHTFGHPPAATTAAPGRINIIGDHTDYNEGLSLATAINRWVIVSVSERMDQRVQVRSANYKETINFTLGEILPGDEKWHRIVSGIAHILKETYGIRHGFEAYIWGNIPLGSGVSSSAAIEVALLNALRTLYRLSINSTQLVLHCQQTEHKYMHVKSGLLDQYTSQFSKENTLLLLDFQTVSHRYIPADTTGYQWVLVNSMVKRELASSKYSERVEETQEAFAQIKAKYPEVKHFRDIRAEHTDAIADKTLRNRILHYIEENARVNNFVEAIQANDWVRAGNYLNDSHRSLKEQYETSCEELDFLAEKGAALPGCLGSRIMGGGFGGCTINLVEETSIEAFKKEITTLYKAKYNCEPEINIYQNVMGAYTESYPVQLVEKTTQE
jgi:galactokinase